MTTRPTAQQWEQAWLPLWPLASDDLLEGIYRQSRPEALQRRYVEANPQALSNLLVVDIDHGDAALRALGTRPLPHVIVENPRNGHAHAVWGLREPVTRTEYAHRKPLAFAASVTEGLRRAVDGDQAYSGLITKNPMHAHWAVQLVTPLDALYDLDELATGLGDDMPPARWRETRSRRADPVGLGRNCALFESARHWAYREIPNHWGDPHGLYAAIHAEVIARNEAFSEPLPVSEARAIAASIHRWIVTKSRMWHDGPAVYEATFLTIQSARGKKSAEARRQRAAEMWEQA